MLGATTKLNLQCEKLCFRVYICKWFCWVLLITLELLSNNIIAGIYSSL